MKFSELQLCEYCVVITRDTDFDTCVDTVYGPFNTEEDCDEFVSMMQKRCGDISLSFFITSIESPNLEDQQNVSRLPKTI